MKALKNVISFAVGALSCASLLAGEMKEEALKDVVMMKDGKMMLIQEGKTIEMKKHMTMADGTKVMKDGTLITPDGQKKKMRDGDMVRMDGKMMRMKDGKLVEKP